MQIQPYLMRKNPEGDQLYLQFVENKFECFDEIFKKAMDNLGVQIPPQKRESFNEKRFVYPSDNTLFEKAFREIYYPLHMPKNEYYWSV